MSAHHAGCQYKDGWQCTQDCLEGKPELCSDPDACPEVKTLRAERDSLRLKLDETERAGADIRRKNEALLADVQNLKTFVELHGYGDDLDAWRSSLTPGRP